MEIDVTINFTQAIDLTAIPDYNGLPVPLDGPAVWSVVSGLSTLGTALEGGAPLPADGLMQSLRSEDQPGDSRFRVAGPTANGEIESFVNLHVVSPPANNIGLSAGAAYPKV